MCGYYNREGGLKVACVVCVQVLAEQAAGLVESDEAPSLPPQAQRRLMRILRDIDMNALEKLLLWETAFKESAEAGEGRDGKPRVRRLLRRIRAAINNLNEQGVRLCIASGTQGISDAGQKPLQQCCPTQATQSPYCGVAMAV